VPSDRRKKSLFLNLSAFDNVLSASFVAVARHGLWRNKAAEGRLFDEGAAEINLQPPRRKLDALRFSGGNQQKIVLSRWLKHGELEDTRVLLLDEPTQGVDVGARGELYDAVRKFADGGRGVVFVSSEADEMVQVADRVVVLARGRVVGCVQGADITERKLMELAHFGESEDIGSAGLVATHEREDSRV
jgi:ABC-type sugar transport system ATPase subunit